VAGVSNSSPLLYLARLNDYCGRRLARTGWGRSEPVLEVSAGSYRGLLGLLHKYTHTTLALAGWQDAIGTSLGYALV